eukprot:6201660-Pleurochrysis_carterae.AAC.2
MAHLEICYAGRTRPIWASEPVVHEFIRSISHRETAASLACPNSQAIQARAMAPRAGVPLRRLSVGLRGHLAAAIADSA